MDFAEPRLYASSLPHRTYTPPTALVLHFLTPSSPWVAILVALAVSFQCDFIVGKYAALIKDKELLAGEVMHEYDQKVSCRSSLSPFPFLSPSALPSRSLVLPGEKRLKGRNSPLIKLSFFVEPRTVRLPNHLQTDEGRGHHDSRGRNDLVDGAYFSIPPC